MLAVKAISPFKTFSPQLLSLFSKNDQAPDKNKLSPKRIALRGKLKPNSKSVFAYTQKFQGI